MTLQEAKKYVESRKWNHHLGFSKRELGIKTRRNNSKNELRRLARSKTKGQKSFFKLFKRLINNEILLKKIEELKIKKSTKNVACSTTDGNY